MRIGGLVRLGLRLAMVLVAFATFADTARAQDRWALVLGVSTYDSPLVTPLKNTLNDARTVAASLNLSLIHI